MTLHQYPDLEQGSEDWLNVRRGIITASTVGQLVTPTTIKVARNDYSRALTATLVAERITGWTEDVYVNSDMQRGVDDEPLARAAYTNYTRAAVEQVGFMIRDFDGYRIGYSPDGLVGTDGLIEIKSRRPKKHVTTVLSNRVPLENMAQLQCGLLVSGRAWVDYISYAGGMHLWVKRVEPDDRWFDAIQQAAATFEETAAAMVLTYQAAVHGRPLTERTPDYAEIRF